MKKETDRIPYHNWAHSQLSIARHYWSIDINWDLYEFDREVVKQMAKDTDENKLYEVDLVHYWK